MRRLSKWMNKEEEMIELDLAPLLALMVKLVPVLLLSSVFVHVAIIETDLPQAVQNSVEQNDQQPVFSLKVKVHKSEGIKISVKDAQKGEAEFSIPSKDGKQDLTALHDKLKDIKTKYPNQFSMEIFPDPSVPYEDIISIIDQARRDAGSLFEAIDPKTGKQYKTELMFPDVVFADVLEG